MNRKTRLTASASLTLVAALAGCGTAPKASGHVHDARHLMALTHLVTRQVDDYQRQCTTKYRTKTTYTGSGKFRKSTTSSVPYQDCKRVKVGSHSVTRNETYRPERYCVKLDHTWYTVDSGTYWKATRHHGSGKIKISYLNKGC